MVLAKLPVSWRPSYLNNSLHKSLLHLQKEGAAGGCVDSFSLTYHCSSFLPHFWRRPDIDRNTVSRAVKTKTTNRPKIVQKCKIHAIKGYNNGSIALLGICHPVLYWPRL